jgi:uncharacterized protein YacL (UPF0231 family)
MSKVLLGARLPETIITDLRNYCKSHGIVMNYFVTEAITEKLQELKEDEQDVHTVKRRLKEDSISEKEWDLFLANRGVNV